MKTLFALLIVVGACVWVWYPRSEPPPGHRMSADNVYYLLGYVAVRTPHGMSAFTPGQQVEAAATYAGPYEPGKLAVTDGVVTMPVSRTLLTHDMDLAEQLARQDSQGQSDMDAARLSEIKRQEAERLAASIAGAQDVQRDSQRRTMANSVGSSTRLDQAPVSMRGHSGGYTGTSGYYVVPRSTPAPVYHSPLFNNNP